VEASGPQEEVKSVTVKPHSEMIEGPEAFDRFKEAVKAVLTVPKSAMPPSPFGRRTKTKKPEAPKG
jgi:hypothetical protein